MMSLIVQREQARQAKDFATADSLREKLAELGVQLFDKTNSWKCSDGRSGRIPTWQAIESGESGQAAPQAIEPVDQDPVVAHIKHLVISREQARAAKDFAKSDYIRDELKGMGVDLQDKEKIWRSKDGKAGIIIGYRSSSGPTDVEINTLVIQREKARQANDYLISDMVRDELKVFGVNIFDKDKVWRASDGRSGAVPSWDEIMGGAPGGAPAAPIYGAAPMPQSQYGQFGGNDLKSQVVQAALHAASTPANARKVLQMLQSLNSGGGAAAAASAPRGPAQGGPIQPVKKAVAKSIPAAQSGNPEVQEAVQFINQCAAEGRIADDSEIEWVVTIREKMRQNKDYAASDVLRNALRDSLGVTLKEKEKLWESNDGRQGQIPLWGTLN